MRDEVTPPQAPLLGLRGQVLACSSSNGSRPSDGGAPARGGSRAGSEAHRPCGTVAPGPSNTGLPKDTKRVPSGSSTVNQDGQIVEDLDIDGTITVLANDVEDSEIEGTSGNATSGVAFAHYTAHRLNVSEQMHACRRATTTPRSKI